MKNDGMKPEEKNHEDHIEEEKNLFSQQMGERIRIRRKEKGMSQADLADAVELSEVAISNIENGYSNTASYNLHLIANVLEMPVTSLMYGDMEYQDEQIHELLTETQKLKPNLKKLILSMLKTMIQESKKL